MESIRYITGSFSDAGAWSNKKKLRSLVQQKHTFSYLNKGITNPRNTDLSFCCHYKHQGVCLGLFIQKLKNLNLENQYSVQSIMRWVYPREKEHLGLFCLSQSFGVEKKGKKRKKKPTRQYYC